MVGLMTKKHLIYEIIFAILALVTVGLAFVDIAGKIPTEYYKAYRILDWTILIIFAVDYFVRLFKAENKKRFFKENIFDLLAIIPFDSLFRSLRIFRLAKLLKLLRLFAVAGRFNARAGIFLKTNGFLYILYFTVASILTGSVLIYFAEKGHTIENFQDAIWWAFVTTTTVGYGDISPATTIGRLVAACLMIIGIGFISMLTGTIATFFLGKIEKQKPHQIGNTLDLSELDEKEAQAIKDIFEVLKNK